LLPAVLPACAADAERNPPVALVFRAAAHPAFDRLVFDAPKGMGYKIARQGETARVIFDRSARVRLREAGLARAAALAADEEDGKLVVRFRLAAAATLKSFKSGASIVVDVYGPPAGPASAEKEKALPAASSAIEATAKTGEEKGEEGKGRKERKKETPPQIAATAKSQAKSPVAPPIAPPAASSISTPAVPPSSTPVLAPVPASAAKTPPISQANTAAETEKVRALDEAFVNRRAAAMTMVAPTLEAKEPLVLGDQPVLAATIDPKIVTGAVIFARAGEGVMLFDRKITVDPAALVTGSPLRLRLQPFDLPRNTGFRFLLPPGAALRATRENTAWKIFLTRESGNLAVSTEIIAQPDFALGARLLLPTAAPPDPVKAIDPVVGDALILVPLRETVAFTQPRRLADLTLLPSAQGLVVKPETDKVVARTVAEGVEISAEGGLRLSPARDRDSAGRGGQVKTGAQRRLFALDAWRGKVSFTETRQQLMQTVVDVPEEQKPLARLELARFYFAHGRGAEAAALLGLLEKQVPDLVYHADYLALRGAVKVLANDPQGGAQDLADPRLAGLPEVDLWQGWAAAALRNWLEAEPKLALGHALLLTYPAPLLSQGLLLSSEAAVAAGKDQEAALWLDELAAKDATPETAAAVAYLRGALAVRAGHAEEAGKLWRVAAKSDNRLYKVRAEMGLVDLDVATHSLTPLQAIEKLEGLRYAWRGDDLEIEILHRLGLFYFDVGNYKAGLATMQQALRYFPQSPAVEPLRADMRRAFREVFLGEKGKAYSPVESLALYQQYKDLCPTGDDGNAVLKALAEKLVAIDLLDQASALLTELVKNGLKGEEKARVSARLAAIRLLDHKPDLTLAALDLAQGEPMPAALAAERTVLRARALAESGKYDEALALLQDGASDVGKKLRADILIKSKRWAEGAKALLDLAGPPAAKKEAPAQADALLGAAIAFAMAGDNAMLDKLAIDYGATMTGTAQEDAFRILTRPDKTLQARDIAAAEARLSEVDSFRGFLDSYRRGESGAAAK
jgi:hypothetical protein